MHGHDENSKLRYLDASQVESPIGELAGVEVRGIDDEKIGSVEGVLVDPAERRLRFFVIQAPGFFNRRRYLLPTDFPARVDPDRKSLCIEIDRRILSGCEEFKASSVLPYSEDDLVTSMFSRRSA